MIASLSSKRQARFFLSGAGHVGSLSVIEERAACIADIENILALDQDLMDCLTGLEGTLELVEAARLRSAGNSAAPTPVIMSVTGTPQFAGVFDHSETLSNLVAELDHVVSYHKKLLEGQTVTETMHAIDALRGQSRALQFALPILREEQTLLLSKQGRSQSEFPQMQRELASLVSDRSALKKTVDEMRSQLGFLHTRLETEYPSESELEGLGRRNSVLRKEVEELESSLREEKSGLEDLKGAGGLELARWELRARKKDLLEALRDLECLQREVCETFMKQLSFAIDREEKTQKLGKLEQELFSLSESEKDLFSIPEHVALNYEGGDIESRQQDLVSLHRTLQQCSLVHKGLLERIRVLDRELS